MNIVTCLGFKRYLNEVGRKLRTRESSARLRFKRYLNEVGGKHIT